MNPILTHSERARELLAQKGWDRLTPSAWTHPKLGTIYFSGSFFWSPLYFARLP